MEQKTFLTRRAESFPRSNGAGLLSSFFHSKKGRPPITGGLPFSPEITFAYLLCRLATWSFTGLAISIVVRPSSIVKVSFAVGWESAAYTIITVFKSVALSHGMVPLSVN
jgi:hypothetical protein